MSNFNPELTPKKWSAALWKWIKDQFSELQSQIHKNHESTYRNTGELENVGKRLAILENSFSGLNDRLVDAENVVKVLLDSTKANFDDIEALKSRVSNLDGLHDGDEVVLVFEQVGHQSVTRFHGSMTAKEAQSYVDRLGRPLYMAACLSPTLPEEEEE